VYTICVVHLYATITREGPVQSSASFSLHGSIGNNLEECTGDCLPEIATQLMCAWVGWVQRSWSVIRFNATVPGVWQFHCHMEQHIPLGMVMAINVRLCPPDLFESRIHLGLCARFCQQYSGYIHV
jgi:hypothetical protein